MSKREADLLVSVQNVLLNEPVARTARALSHFGEHDLGWLATAGVGVGVDKRNRRKWLAMAAGTFVAHAASVVLKRIVRRKRPTDPRIVIGVSTPSTLSFPSSHSTSTAAAMVHLADISGSKLPYVGIPVMMLSRMVLGVHYPTDTLIGSLIGAGVAKAAIGLEKETR
ncbi:phosphatase PAP2 family protein [Corynebacterium qintianiae]|uniref:Phosphatase PAP2 family protein n=1 Tax=Corynebacterium qintianiae TaxID=2709392 RepID=A0A7T0KNM1_9CORY|nr:phosphatase PAP2 family protein [Corynebacterium qintianiae]QPK83133.1 phosphatase PAP2 family protein [Corynebacterium qintianiae]